jgi:hypothetical protein
MAGRCRMVTEKGYNVLPMFDGRVVPGTSDGK